MVEWYANCMQQDFALYCYKGTFEEFICSFAWLAGWLVDWWVTCGAHCMRIFYRHMVNGVALHAARTRSRNWSTNQLQWRYVSTVCIARGVGHAEVRYACNILGWLVVFILSYSCQFR